MDIKAKLILLNCKTFFSDQRNSDILVEILEHKKTGISLRSIEKFVTKFAKSGTSYVKTKDGKIFHIHTEYKSSLSGFSKKYFDPFCRSERITFSISDKKNFETTIGQLNFLRWVIKNGIIDMM